MERLHKTMRAEFFAAHERESTTIGELQAALDVWVEHYNTERPHQALGMCPPVQRFRLAAARVRPAGEHLPGEDVPGEQSPAPLVPAQRHPGPAAGVLRWVDPGGFVSLAGFRYRVGPVFAGEQVQVLAVDGLVQVYCQGVLVATHAQRHRRGTDPTGPLRASRQRPARATSTGTAVARIVDGAGSVSFAGTMYRVGRAWRRRTVQVAIVAGSVQISADGTVLRVHPIRHDRSKEHGALATPNGRPRKNRISPHEGSPVA